MSLKEVRSSCECDINPMSRSAGGHRRSRGENHRHYEQNKLVSKLQPGETSLQLDVGGLSDTNKCPRGKEKAKSS